MFDFGDELTIESYRIPWLIWIQLLVLVLLIFLLFSFTLLVSDNSDGNSASSSSSQLVPNKTQIEKPISKHTTTPIVRNCLHNSQVGEQALKGEIATGTSQRLVREGEEVTETEGSSGTHKLHHPCNYFRLATLAFLKCLGLDSTFENSNLTPDESKRKEQKKRTER